MARLALAHLACTRHAHSREALAALLWPEYADARNAPRRTLSTLQNGLGQGWLTVDRDQVALSTPANLWLDVAEFESRLGPQAGRSVLAAGLALYHDDFLAGFTLRDSPAFDEWQFFEAERLRQLCHSLLRPLAPRQPSRSSDATPRPPWPSAWPVTTATAPLPCTTPWPTCATLRGSAKRRAHLREAITLFAAIGHDQPAIWMLTEW
jgi:hypothetical protein